MSVVTKDGRWISFPENISYDDILEYKNHQRGKANFFARNDEFPEEETLEIIPKIKPVLYTQEELRELSWENGLKGLVGYYDYTDWVQDNDRRFSQCEID